MITIEEGQMDCKVLAHKYKIISLAIIIIIMAVCNADSFSSAKEARISGIAKVTDGDGLILYLDNNTTEKIRLFALDAPESSQKCFHENGRKFRCGKISAANLINMIEGRTVECKAINRDQYKRLVSICYLSGIDIGKAQVASGMARAWPRYSNIYVNDERQAIKNKLGFWRGRWIAPWEYRRNQRKS